MTRILWFVFVFHVFSQREQIAALQEELGRQRQRPQSAGLEIHGTDGGGFGQPYVHHCPQDASAPGCTVAPERASSSLQPREASCVRSSRPTSPRCSAAASPVAIDADSSANSAERGPELQRPVAAGSPQRPHIAGDSGGSRLVSENKFLKAKLKSVKRTHKRLKQ